MTKRTPEQMGETITCVIRELDAVIAAARAGVAWEAKCAGAVTPHMVELAQIARRAQDSKRDIVRAMSRRYR